MKPSDIPHDFSDEGLLAKALVPGSREYQRLEWLGDRALGLIVAKHLHQNHLRREVGELTRAFSNLVNNRCLSKVGLKLGFSGESETDDVSWRAACTIEALVGAVLLDGGMKATDDFVKRIYGDLLSNPGDEIWGKDSKSFLKEHCEGIKSPLPTYSNEGPDDEGLFHSTCAALGKTGSGKDKTKVGAEIAAAAAILGELNLLGNNGK